MELWILNINVNVNGFTCVKVHSKHGNFRKRRRSFCPLRWVSTHHLKSTDIYVALEPQPISKSLTWAEFYTVRAGSDDRIFNYYVIEQKTSRCHLGAVLAAKVGFSPEVELLAILEDDAFLLSLKILDALEQFLKAATGTRERKASEMWKNN